MNASPAAHASRPARLKQSRKAKPSTASMLKSAPTVALAFLPARLKRLKHRNAYRRSVIADRKKTLCLRRRVFYSAGAPDTLIPGYPTPGFPDHLISFLALVLPHLRLTLQGTKHTCSNSKRFVLVREDKHASDESHTLLNPVNESLGNREVT